MQKKQPQKCSAKLKAQGALAAVGGQMTVQEIMKKYGTSKTAVYIWKTDTIRYKLMPDGHIRAYQHGTPDKRGVSEGNIYPPHICAPTVTTSGHINLLMANERVLQSLMRSVSRSRK